MEEIDPKRWYESRTNWFNIATAISSLVAYYGLDLSPEVLVVVLTSIVGLVLRQKTKKEVVW
jgi:hypothetical protein